MFCLQYLQQKESWENLESNLRNQIQKSEQSRLALEEEVASLKTTNIALRVKAEENIAILKAGIKTDNVSVVIDFGMCMEDTLTYKIELIQKER